MFKQAPTPVAGQVACGGRFGFAYHGVAQRFSRGEPENLRVGSNGKFGRCAAALTPYDAEIGVVGNSPSAPDLVEIPMGDAPIVAIMAQGFLPETVQELAFKQLVKWPLVFREKGSSTRRCIEAEAQACGLRLRPVIEVDGREALREVVASGAGIGFVSRAELGNASDIRAVAISGVTLRMKESLVFLSIRRDQPMVRAFSHYITPRWQAQ